jgi:FMN phosphatase YigB (HAD superfamily)
MTSADKLTPMTPVQALFFDLDETLLDGRPFTLPLKSL